MGGWYCAINSPWVSRWGKNPETGGLGMFAPTAWWRHQMETFSALLAICAGNSPVPGEFPSQRPVTRTFDVYFDLRLNKRSWGWWFETLSSPLWRHTNGELIAQYRPTMWFTIHLTLICVQFVLLQAWNEQKTTLSPRTSASTQPSLLLWWCHNIYFWRPNGTGRHARANHYEYFVFENCTQTLRIYWSKNPVEPLYIYTL